MPFLDKLFDLFNPLSHFPETSVQEEMMKEGWKFEVNCTMHPLGASIVGYAVTPDGKAAAGASASEQTEKLYIDTVAAKRAKLGLAPQ